MSAICGIVHFGGAPVDGSDLERMARSSPGRGPDGSHAYIDANAGLSHLAFHVTPESRTERQPVLGRDGRHALVADVRLDNRDELARLLCIEPGLLKGLSDADLLLRAFERWGVRCAERLLGDFVFAVWDRTSRELFLARDPLGAFSLSHVQSGQTFAFASETAALLDTVAAQPEINADAVAKTLVGMPLEPDETYFSQLLISRRRMQ